MSVVISDDVLYTAQISTGELLQEIAILLYQRDKLTLGQANLAQISQLQFQLMLGSRQIAIHYDVVEFEKDLKTLQGMESL